MKTIRERSLLLAELMEWEIKINKVPSDDWSWEAGVTWTYIHSAELGRYMNLRPYKSTVTGLSQFATILLRDGDMTKRVMQDLCITGEPFTQENFLNAYLRMNNKEID